ncbi:I78 family peptidase inhibitor [Ramlibacter sp. AN1015]|uniref:I78 family peptidase inhibitor n=1 Tax=Ramlibacter sp. AN1015 TaxID=3133428 RepID=UPI0030BE0746
MRGARITALLAACAALLLVLQACAQKASSTEPHGSTGNACDASAARFAIGMAPERELLDRMQRVTGASTVRTTGFNEMVTKEYRVGRLNVQLGTDGRIQQLTCG